MSRDISASNISASGQEVVRPVFFVKLEYDSGTSYVHSSVGELTFGANIYQGVGGLGTIEAIEEDLDLIASGVRLTLSGVDSSIIVTALGEDYQGRPATIYLGLLDADMQLIDDPFIIFSGRMDTQSISLGAEASVTLTIENRLVDWDRPRTLRYNNETQQSRFAGDKGLEFVEQAAEKRIVWGQNS